MDLSQGTLIAILAAVLIADVLVVVVALAWTQLQKRRQRAAWATPASVPPSLGVSDPRAGAMGGGPYGGGVMGMASGGNATAGRSGMGGAGGISGAGAMGSAGAPDLGGVLSGRGAAPTPTIGAAPTDPNVDLLTGLLLQSAWTRVVSDEEARIRRYHRPATVVIIEVEGLQRLATRLGSASVERIIPAIADTIRRGARESDHVARLASGRFAVLLPETDDVLAINYIERVRRACDLWLESGAVALRLAIGWATSTSDGSLADAEALATDRMYTELRRAARSMTPPAGPGPIEGAVETERRAFGA